MRQTATNEFKDGLNLDLHPIVTPKTVLTDNLNGTFITYNGNEFCLQNDRGNTYVDKLKDKYIPIGVKEHNGILYIVSVNGDKTEIGTFPSPNYDKSNYQDPEDLVPKYKALRVLENRSELTNQELGYTVKTPVTIEIQDSYDGSVNLIIVAEENKPRIINSGFSVLPNGKYKFVNREQKVRTNIYEDLFKESELIRTSEKLTNITLEGVQSGGQWKGGNYTFYLKFGDADFNQTDVVAESGIVSIFNGNDGKPATISGTLLDERTDKMIHLLVEGLNPVYSKIYIYFTREYSDTQGYRLTESGMLQDPIDMERDTDIQHIWLTGFEQQVPVNIEELNVDYHTVDCARAEAQHSNMLFLGNVRQNDTFMKYQELRTIAENTDVMLSTAQSFPAVGYSYNNGEEYYSVSNIYNYVGYYPGELYRFGIVFILDDGSKSPVFNIKSNAAAMNLLPSGDSRRETFEKLGLVLIKGENTDVYVKDGEDLKVKPIGLRFSLPITMSLPDYVKGWFVVRQKRIPNVICEGINIAVDKKSNLPVVYNGTNWIMQSFIDADRNKATLLNVNRTDNNNVDSYKKKINLTYNNSDVGSASFKLEEFKEWLVTTNRNYANLSRQFWLDLNEGGDLYSPSSSFYQTHSSNEDDAQFYIAGLVDMAQQWQEANPDKPRMSEEVDFYTDTTSNGSPNSDVFREEVTRMRDITSHFILHWYQLYQTTVVEDGNEIEINVAPTNRYLVGTLSGLEDWRNIKVEYYSGVVNATLDNWISEYNRVLGTKSLENKTMVEWLPKSNVWKEADAILSLDPCVKSSIGGMFDGSEFKICRERSVTAEINREYTRIKYIIDEDVDETANTTKAIFIPSNTGVKVVGDKEFSNVAGEASDASKYKSFTYPAGSFENRESNNSEGTGRCVLMTNILNAYTDEDMQKALSRTRVLYQTNLNINIIRGLFTPYIGLDCEEDLHNKLGIYSLRHKENVDVNDLVVRSQDNSEYFCVSPYLSTDTTSKVVYRGDCFTNTVTMRIIRNFIDPTAPVSDTILDEAGWRKYVVGFKLDKDHNFEISINDPDKLPFKDGPNVSDVNTVDLGLWVTFKCLSSYNLGLRSNDTFHVDEMALLGSPRSFYPLNGASTSTGNKTEESYLLNDGLSATVGRKRYELFPSKAPYSKSEFANRIMFSNINITDAFTNGYRTFQGLSYKDYDKQYGAITKLIPLGQNLFVVMEHGLALVPVNPKALMQTTTGEAIHIYGHGVLPDEMTIISQDYGSKYEHSVIRTPIGIYGIDADAKKIWVFSDKQGFNTFSDMHIETYLKDNLEPIEVEMGRMDIRTHYNAKKGDIMFTWNKKNEADEIELYSICYNERQGIWTTRYDWKPTVSDNINDAFYSLNNEAIWEHADFCTHNGHVSSWYGNDHIFEFEFVVSDPIGVNKIFDNLQILSNNVQPTEMEITVMGDDYEFKRDVTHLEDVHTELARKEYEGVTDIKTTSDTHGNYENRNTVKQSPFGYYHFDRRLNQSTLTKWQPFKDIYKFGRRIGNIQYKDGSWHAQIEPLLVNDQRLVAKEARIRDKWAKIRIRYSGKDLAIITAVTTLINI